MSLDKKKLKAAVLMGLAVLIVVYVARGSGAQ